MSLLFESIRISEGRINNIRFHNLRFNRTRRLLFGTKNTIYLQNHIQIPDYAKKGVFKCRIIYNSHIQSIAFEPYKPRTIESLQVIRGIHIEYSFKYTDRTTFQALLSQCSEADEILIVKNGLITDTSYTNILLFDGTIWSTPRQPLLAGTMRASLLRKGIIIEKDLTLDHLVNAQNIRLINAMLPFEAAIDINPRLIIK